MSDFMIGVLYGAVIGPEHVEALKAAQEMLGHRKEETTRIYVSRITAQKDRFSGDLADVFGIEE